MPRTTQQLQTPVGNPDRAWASRLVGDLKRIFANIFDGDLTLGGKLHTVSGRITNVRLVVATPDTLKLTDERVDVNVAAAAALTLPLNPDMGQEIVVNDSSGAAAANNITVSAPVSISLNGVVSGSVVIATNYARRTFLYNGTQWTGS